MKKLEGQSLSRRDFLKTTGLLTGGLVVAVQLSGCSGKVPSSPWKANAFVEIATDDQVIVWVNQQEMGQGVYTSLPMLLAEELDVDWNKVSMKLAPFTPEYGDPRGTGGSWSVRASWQSFREAGAKARAMLVAAAAQQWAVSPESLQTEKGEVIHGASGRRANYGSLVSIAATLPAPEKVELKDPKDFKIIGTDVKRIEALGKVTGKAQYSLDIQLPGMLTAVVAHPPVNGDTVKSYRAEQALAVSGVVNIKQISSGVAVIAKDFWTAKTARDKLEIEWEPGPATSLCSAQLQQQYRELADQPGPVVEEAGSIETVFNTAEKTVEAVYELPYLAHACMEPLNCIVQVKQNACVLWLGTQSQSADRDTAVRILGIPPEQVKVNATLMGGGFGRRSNPNQDFVIDALEIARDETVPVKTVWTREEDIQGGFYRPMATHQIKAGLNGTGMPVGWHQRLVAQSLMVGTPYEQQAVTDGVDPLSADGAIDMAYAIPDRRVELHGPLLPVSVLWWRSVSHTHTAFAGECFIDEIAHTGGQDPFALRQKLLQDQPRHLQVLELAAKKAGWGKPLKAGRAQGIAMRHSFGSYVAQVAEVSLTQDNQVKVHRVVCAVDCGIAVNPLNIRAQIEGSIVFGLGAALYGEITFEEGKVQQSNFHDFLVLRMNAMPEIEVHIVQSSEYPGGIGEPGVPPIAPAVANALFALTGERIRKLPIKV